MTREEIIRMAQEAGLEDEVLVPWAYEINMFAALVADAERNRTWTQEHWTEYERSIAAAERNRLATKLVQDFKGAFGDDTCASWAVWIKEQKT